MKLQDLQVISPEMHGLLDYATSAALIAAPGLLPVGDDSVRGRLVPRMVGAVIAGQSVLTDYRLGLLKVLPFRVHLALDLMRGGLLAVGPLAFSRSRRGTRTWLPHLLLGGLMLATAALTRTGSRWHTEAELRKWVPQPAEAEMEREIASQWMPQPEAGTMTARITTPPQG